MIKPKFVNEKQKDCFSDKFIYMYTKQMITPRNKSFHCRHCPSLIQLFGQNGAICVVGRYGQGKGAGPTKGLNAPE